MKSPIGIGALKPDKVETRKTTAKVSGHMPVMSRKPFGNKTVGRVKTPKTT